VGQRPLAKEGALYLDINAGVPEFLVTPLLMGPVCLLSRGRFKGPWAFHSHFAQFTSIA